MVNGKPYTTKNERPSATKTLEYFFADISNYIRKNKDKGLTGDTKSTRENISVQNLGDKYGNFAEKQFNNLKSSVNKKTSKGSNIKNG